MAVQPLGFEETGGNDKLTSNKILRSKWKYFLPLIFNDLFTFIKYGETTLSIDAK